MGIFNLKKQKAIFKRSKTLSRTRWINCPRNIQNALYVAKNRLKRHHLIFYNIYIWKYTQIFIFHARTHVYTHQNSNLTHYGNHSTLTKRFFQKFFLSRNFKFLIFGFSRNFGKLPPPYNFGFLTWPRPAIHVKRCCVFIDVALKRAKMKSIFVLRSFFHFTNIFCFFSVDFWSWIFFLLRIKIIIFCFILFSFADKIKNRLIC